MRHLQRIANYTYTVVSNNTYLRGLYSMKNIKGFSLIELIVVITIVAILAAIAVSAYNNYTTKSKFSTMMNTVNAILNNAKTYRGTNGAWPIDYTQIPSLQAVLNNQVPGLIGASLDIQFDNSAACNYFYFDVQLDTAYFGSSIPAGSFLVVEVGENISNGVITTDCVIIDGGTLNPLSNEYIKCPFNNFLFMESAAGNNTCP